MNEHETMLVVFVAGTLLLTIFAFFLVMSLIVQKRKQNNFSQEILKTNLEVQEKAINHMSHELHDNIGSRLNALKRFMQAMEMPDMQAATILEIKKDCVSLLDDVIKDTRDLSHTLNSDFVLNKGLLESVRKELDYIEKSTTIKCGFTVNGDYHSLDQGHELLLFRMIQETIANVIKHAQATQLNIVMDYEPSTFSVKITDNGKGFDTDAKGDGIGLSNMRNRARMIKGSLNIESKRDIGTTLMLSIKL